MAATEEQKVSAVEIMRDLVRANGGDPSAIPDRKSMKTTKEYLSRSSIDNEPREMFDEEEMGAANLETGMEYQIEVVCRVKPMLEGQKAYVVPMLCSPLPKERVLEAVELAAKSERFKIVMQSILGEQL